MNFLWTIQGTNEKLLTLVLTQTQVLREDPLPIEFQIKNPLKTKVLHTVQTQCTVVKEIKIKLKIVNSISLSNFIINKMLFNGLKLKKIGWKELSVKLFLKIYEKLKCFVSNIFFRNKKLKFFDFFPLSVNIPRVGCQDFINVLALTQSRNVPLI